ncbi:Zn(II)2Cys6 transcription factor domain-containing protein NDAI_0F00110 [Naumovozyma dairenensis CBS 421]|uniref:Zn(2)-C6 fungal-type domain-containing protein n=1 Tax=Naumovozyma dairenensis (strain ATCC 10597 / BCRC 20456 / CBS 421 / NBRC 0211 / NRRL Y-12639) TaxID=1071378 RepID=G0WC19_NAUDC|nr:hypothetical protein NDAI_0F00110 [Naumovozyma dairenensis CBS 421]CCD25330.1 hypothetical protein NDAI_0F00110 [Naumovozyma dairenensis CBS 421]
MYKVRNKHEQLHRNRSYSGCWTCRARKVKCDTQRPKCCRCKQLGIECGGYDIKLQWANPIKFDKYGVQLTNPLRNTPKNTEDGFDTNLSIKSKTKTERFQYQRSNIAPVKYKYHYACNEDIDDELMLLNDPPLKLLENNRTWVINNFGVFQGLNLKRLKEKRQNETETIPSRKEQSERNPDTSSISRPILPSPDSSENIEPIIGEKARTTLLPELMKDQNNAVEMNTNYLDWLLENDIGAISIPGLDKISDELREDVLLSAIALQGLPTYNMSLDPVEVASMHETENKLPSIGASTRHSSESILPNMSITKGETIPSQPNDESLEALIHTLFNKQPSPIDLSDPNVSYTRVPNNLDDIWINAPDQLSKMPRTAMEIVHSDVKDDFAIELTSDNEYYMRIPENSLTVHGLTRLLLNHFMDTVADLMPCGWCLKKSMEKHPFSYCTKCSRRLGWFRAYIEFSKFFVKCNTSCLVFQFIEQISQKFQKIQVFPQPRNRIQAPSFQFFEIMP